MSTNKISRRKEIIEVTIIFVLVGFFLGLGAIQANSINAAPLPSVEPSTCWTESTAYGPEVICGDPATAVNVIEEDSPQWNCATMGNKICGEVK